MSSACQLSVSVRMSANFLGQSKLPMPALNSAVANLPGQRTVATDLLRRWMSFPVFLGALLAGGACVAAHFRFVDPDTWWHIRVGEMILQHHFPTADPYSFTAPGAPWIAYEWFGEVVIAFAARYGFSGLASLQFIWASALTVLTFYFSYLRSKNVKAAFLATVFALVMFGAFFTLRPQVLGYIFMLIMLVGLERYRQGLSRSLWWLPLLFLFWVNTHGTFFLGLGVFGIYWLTGLANFSYGSLYGEKWSPEQSLHMLTVALVSVALLPLTPYGTRLATYPFQMAFMQPLNVSSIIEWQPLSFALPFGKIMMVALLLLVLAQVLFRMNHSLTSFVLLMAGAFAAYAHIRFLLFFLLFLTPKIAELLSRWIPEYEPAKDKPALNLIITLCIVAGSVYYVSNPSRLSAPFLDTYPVKAVDYLRDHPQSSMLNEYGWGGYLIHELYPQQKVFIDGRADFYEYAGVFSDYLDIMRLDPDAFRLLDRYNIGACLIPRKSILATVLGRLPEWKVAYSDDIAVLYVRDRALNRPLRPVSSTGTPESRTLALVSQR
jgi:hypothetical protein